ncbi:AMP-binding protein [Spongiibacter marinus]|uniref:AMP-binding protein n=1 Tax=Spongiibacter marinus TaxID=354246 RepID=UPI0035BE2FBD
MREQLTPLQMFYHWESKSPDATWLHSPENRSWNTLSWKQAGEMVRRIANGITAMDLPAGSKIAILSKNSAYWYICDLAIMMSGHISVPAFTTMDNTGTSNLLKDSETRVMFVGPSENWQSVKNIVPEDIKLISLPGAELGHAWASFDQLLEQHPPLEGNPTPKPEELCTIIYTSGTTGMPKGVMHSHSSLAGAGQCMISTYRTGNEDRFISFLPLSHIFERAVLMQSLACGGQVFFNESLETFTEDMQYCKPTWFCAAPRIWQKFQQAVAAKLGEDKIAAMLQDPTSKLQLTQLVQASLGLDKARILITGGGQTPKMLYDWYEQFDMPLCDIYGMTEAAPATSNVPWCRKKGTVGKPVPGAEVKISDQGEILTRTPCMTSGYYNNPGKSAEDLAGGWMHTGDQGEIDQEGFLKVTGRIKEIFKTAKGKYVAPSKIENKIAPPPFVENLCLVGAGLPATVLIVNLSEASTDNDEIESTLKNYMDAINQQLEKHEKMSHIIVTRAPWTIQNGLLTHTTKIKRAAIEAKYQDLVTKASEKYPSGSIVFED